MTYAELIRLIKKQGVLFLEHGTKHDVYWNPQNGKDTQIPRHQSQEVKKGTLDKILEDLGLK